MNKDYAISIFSADAFSYEESAKKYLEIAKDFEAAKNEIDLDTNT